MKIHESSSPSNVMVWMRELRLLSGTSLLLPVCAGRAKGLMKSYSASEWAMVSELWYADFDKKEQGVCVREKKQRQEKEHVLMNGNQALRSAAIVRKHISSIPPDQSRW